MKDTRKHSLAAGVINIMVIFFFSQAVGGLYAVQDLLTEKFSNVSQVGIAYASTITSLTAMFACLYLGITLGKKVSYKTTAIVGFALYGIGGALPYFITTFPALIVGRALLGIATGALQVLGAPMLADVVRDDGLRSKLTGISSFVCYCGTACITLFAGLAAAANWKFAFLLHAIALIGIPFVFFCMDEPQFEDEAAGESGEEVASEGFFASLKKIPVIVWVMVIGNGLLGMITMQVDISTSYVLGDMGASLELISLLVSLGLWGYALGGLAYIPINKLMGRYTLASAPAIAAIGQVICYFSGNPIVFMVGALISSMGYTLSFTAAMYSITVLVSASLIPVVSSLLMIFMSIGGFLSSSLYAFGISVTGDPVRGHFIVSVICSIIVMIIFCIFKPKKESAE